MLGLVCLWSDMMRDDLGRHGVTKVYDEWSKTYSSLPCITTETRTQGLIEKHNDSQKNVYLRKKSDRLDSVIQSLYAVHMSLKRQYEIESARQTPRKDSQRENEKLFTFSSEKFKVKRNSGKGFYQNQRRMTEKANGDDLLPEWQNISLLRRGGKVLLEPDKETKLYNTCPVDNIL